MKWPEMKVYDAENDDLQPHEMANLRTPAY
jgi:hypothetical protein